MISSLARIPCFLDNFCWIYTTLHNTELVAVLPPTNVLLVLSRSAQSWPSAFSSVPVPYDTYLFFLESALFSGLNYYNSTYSFQPRDSIVCFDMDLYQTDLTRPRRGTPSSFRGFQDFGASAFLYSTHVLERFLWNSKRKSFMEGESPKIRFSRLSGESENEEGRFEENRKSTSE